tara:strand:+ start:306 stop:416 length:111 start_codon:yes stop_codon:yes gene_type:complete
VLANVTSATQNGGIFMVTAVCPLKHYDYYGEGRRPC